MGNFGQKWQQNMYDTDKTFTALFGTGDVQYNGF